MNARGSTERAGAKLKQLREQLGLTLRAVEALSRQLAEKKQNYDFFISRGWLNNVENGTYIPDRANCTRSVPSTVHTGPTCSLSMACIERLRTGPGDVRASEDTACACLAGGEDKMVVPLQSREALHPDQTSLLSKLVDIWGEVPIRLIQHLDLRNGTYGFVGMDDNACIRSFAPVPSCRSTRISEDRRDKWESEHERPIYFLELRGAYLCSWCEMSGGYLSAVPHPHSKCEVAGRISARSGHRRPRRRRHDATRGDGIDGPSSKKDVSSIPLSVSS